MIRYAYCKKSSDLMGTSIEQAKQANECVVYRRIRKGVFNFS